MADNGDFFVFEITGGVASAVNAGNGIESDLFYLCADFAEAIEFIGRDVDGDIAGVLNHDVANAGAKDYEERPDPNRAAKRVHKAG